MSSTIRFAKFVAAGGIAALANWLSRFYFSDYLELGYAVVAAYLVGMTVAFILNRAFVFDRSGRKIHDEYVRFAMVNVLAIAQVWLVTLGLADYVFPAIGWTWHAEAVAHAAGVLTPVFTSYLGHRHFTFAPESAYTEPADPSAPLAPTRALPLVVDLDGTLLKTDTLLENFVLALLKKPFATLAVLPGALRGRAQLKRQLAQLAKLDTALLPVRQDLLDYLLAEHQRGRKLHLVSAADDVIVQAVARRFGIFESAYGSIPPVNLKGRVKLEKLRSLFPGGFVYAGDSAADLQVWCNSDAIILAGAGHTLPARAAALGKPVEAVFGKAADFFNSWRRALRLHQWSKNILIFVPFLLSPIHGQADAALRCVFGFLLMGAAASATYLCNDLADLSSDRRHATKRYRPLASGDIPISHALLFAPATLVLSIWLAHLLSPAFGISLTVYAVTTLSYSLWLKRVALLDVIVLGGLYTLRLIMGTQIVAVPFSPWLLTFAGFFFCSMSLAKRHVEIVTTSGPHDRAIPGRGYRPGDHPLTLALGVSLSVASILIVVEYLMSEAFPSGLYHAPLYLWAAPVILCIWICRVWLLAHRGELHADPVAFALRDPVSLLLGATLAIAFVLALLT